MKVTDVMEASVIARSNEAIAGAIGQFVQACYTAERAHHEAIDMLVTPEQINAYNINGGWPE